MKKILVLLLSFMLVLTSISMAYASTNLIDNQLKELGYTDHIMKFLDEQEKAEIIENRYIFCGESISHTLFINEIKTFNNGNKIVKSFATEISEADKIKYDLLKNTLFKDKKYKDTFLKEKLNKIKLSNVEPEVYYLDSANRIIDDVNNMIDSVDQYAEDSIDGSILSTGVYAYDKSTTTKIIKRLGFNFQWDGIQFWALKDLIAIQHTGGSIGFANIERSGGSYTYVDGIDSTNTISIDTEVNLYGATGEVDIKQQGNHYGEMYLDISNTKSSIPPDSYFTMIGQYGHVTLTLGASVSVDAGGISFSPTVTSKVTKSTQVVYNNIFTY